jgi:cytidine deaminase
MGVTEPGVRPLLDGVPAGMSAADAELLGAARGLLEQRYSVGRHEVAAAMRLSDGRIITGLHLEASSSRASICAEGGALAAAVAAVGATDAPISACVSVLRRPGGTWHLIEPCGVCAELLVDYAPDARIWLGTPAGFEPHTMRELLPFAQKRTGRAATA